MNIMKVRCPECGEIVTADIDKAAAICEICGAPFVTQDALKAIQQLAGRSREATHPKVEEYLSSAKRAFDNGLYDNARMYYRKAAEYDPNSWEAIFYKALVEYKVVISNRASNSVNYYNLDAYLNDINHKANDISNTINTIFSMISEDAFLRTSEEIYESLLPYFYGDTRTKSYLLSYNSRIVQDVLFYQVYSLTSAKLFLKLGNIIEKSGLKSKEAEKAMLKYWAKGIDVMKNCYEDKEVDIYKLWANGSKAKENIMLTKKLYNDYVSKIKKYDSSYSVPPLDIERGNQNFISSMKYWIIVAGLFIGLPVYNWGTAGGFTKFLLGVLLFFAIPGCTFWLLYVLGCYISRKI